MTTLNELREKYPYTDDMDEISGFGGEYEEACRTMLYAGMLWMEEHPDLPVSYSELVGVYGIVRSDTEGAKELDKALSASCPDMTGGDAPCRGVAAGLHSEAWVGGVRAAASRSEGEER